MSVKAYIYQDALSDPVPGQVARRAMRPDDVMIDILFCGICHTDIHVAHNDWGSTRYPLVPGHEIVGTVTSIGPNVSKFKAGDQVGVGCIVDSCQKCHACNIGKQNWCATRVGTYSAVDVDGTITMGGYSQSVVVRETYVLKMPQNLDLAAAAPLLCAGVTTYSPLKAYGAGRGKKVGIVGLGGLGSTAVKIAIAMGSEVTVFSRNNVKKTGAFDLGAKHYISSSESKEMESAVSSLDLILDTIPVAHDIDSYLKTLRIGGCMVIVGQVGVTSLHTRNLMDGSRLLTASNIGGIPETQEVLDFCSQHNITCDVEVIDYNGLIEAFKRVKLGDVRYRFVLNSKTL